MFKQKPALMMRIKHCLHVWSTACSHSLTKCFQCLDRRELKFATSPSRPGSRYYLSRLDIEYLHIGSQELQVMMM